MDSLKSKVGSGKASDPVKCSLCAYALDSLKRPKAFEVLIVAQNLRPIHVVILVNRVSSS